MQIFLEPYKLESQNNHSKSIYQLPIQNLLFLFDFQLSSHYLFLDPYDKYCFNAYIIQLPLTITESLKLPSPLIFYTANLYEYNSITLNQFS